MSEPQEVGFAILRAPEIESLKAIKQKSAWPVWTALRQRFREGQSFEVSSRDFEDVGVKHEAATAALRAFVNEGMLKQVKAACRVRGSRGVYSFIHTRASCAKAAAASVNRAEITGGKSATPPAVTGGKTDNYWRKNRPKTEVIGGKTAILLGACSPSAHKPKDEEAPSDDRQDARAALRRTIRLAGELQLPLMGLVRTAGSPQAATDLASRWEREKASLTVVRQWLADSPVENEIRVQARCGRVAIDGHEGHAATNGALAVTPRTIGAAA